MICDKKHLIVMKYISEILRLCFIVFFCLRKRNKAFNTCFKNFRASRIPCIGCDHEHFFLILFCVVRKAV